MGGGSKRRAVRTCRLNTSHYGTLYNTHMNMNHKRIDHINDKTNILLTATRTLDDVYSTIRRLRLPQQGSKSVCKQLNWSILGEPQERGTLFSWPIVASDASATTAQCC